MEKDPEDGKYLCGYDQNYTSYSFKAMRNIFAELVAKSNAPPPSKLIELN